MPSGDVIIHKQYPAVLYEALEADGTYFEDVEISGQMFRAQNASYATGAWTYYADGAAYATVQNADGSISHLAASAGSMGDAITWTGNGQWGVYNVLDFGAVSGSTDDQSPFFNAAAEAANDAGGGIVYCPIGTYTILNVIKLYDKTTLRGDGPGVSVLVASAALNGGVQDGTQDIAMIANVNYDQTITAAQADIFIQGIQINGDGGANVGDGSTTDIINGLITLIGVDRQAIWNCVVQSSSNDGIHIASYDSDGTPIGGTDLDVSNCAISIANEFNPSSYDNVDGAAVSLTNVSQATITSNLIGYDNGTYFAATGVFVEGCTNVVVNDNQITLSESGVSSSANTDIIVSNNTIVGTSACGIGSGQSIEEKSDIRAVITANVLDQQTGLGILIGGIDDDGASAIISDNSIVFSESTTSSVGITLSASNSSCHHNTVDLGEQAGTAIICDSSGVSIQGNYVQGASASGSIGLYVDASLSDVTVLDNNITGVVTPFGSGTLDTLAAVTIKNNVGINPYGSVPGPTVSVNTSIPNPYPFDCFAYIKGGSTITVSLDSVSTGLGSNLGYLVPQGGSIKLTYVGGGSPTLPTWIWIAN